MPAPSIRLLQETAAFAAEFQGLFCSECRIVSDHALPGRTRLAAAPETGGGPGRAVAALAASGLQRPGFRGGGQSVAWLATQARFQQGGIGPAGRQAGWNTPLVRRGWRALASCANPRPILRKAVPVLIPDQPVTSSAGTAAGANNAGTRLLKSPPQIQDDDFRAAGMAAASTDHACTMGSECSNPDAMAMVKIMPNAD